MISWIQRYFAKHFKLVFLLILAAMAIPLIVIFSPSGGGRASSRVKERMFFNVNLGNEAAAARIGTDANLSAELKAGYSALQGAQLQEYALERVAGLALADELHLPQPSAAAVAKYVTTLRAFQNESGQFDQKRYTTFGDSLKASQGLSVADVNRVLRDDVRLEQLGALVGGPGYVLPPDVQQQLIRSDTAWTVQVADLKYANFNPAIEAGDAALKKFYDENSFRYEVPVRPRLSYVEFKSADFMPPTAPTEAELRAFYNANIGRFPAAPDASGKAPSPTEDNFPKVRGTVEAALKDAAAARLAVKAANDLTVAIYDRKFAANSAELAEFLAGQRRAAAAIPPFAPDAPPANLPWLAQAAEQISHLSKDRFFTDPVPTGSGYAVLLWNETLPAYQPTFTEVHDRVAADYKESEKRRLFSERGRTLHTQLQAAAKSGPAAFSSAAAAEKLEIKTYANFTLGKPPQDIPYPAVSTLRTLEAGGVSDMVATNDDGYLVYAQEKKLPDITPANPRYGEVQKQIMSFISSTNENSYLGAMVEAELKKTEPATR
ncbi:MAG TPA: peptidyl-prolyl cis-trans isomerase [Lacunisphaera sp.]|nr:peptidyl-prolyl cis-trans isomerase [Lacunisphaera sp.]